MSDALLILISGLFVFVRPVHAYLDPGTGSYLIQVLIGVVLGGIYLLKNFWRNLFSTVSDLFKKLLSKKK